MTTHDINLENLSFETAYEQIGAIVDQLESGELPLEQTLALYERGRQLIKYCEGRLDAAELRISQVSGDSDGGFRVDSLK
ncbi:MAG: exodeoxyribonuclease VII small subunit [Anaerolineae bacterium]|nr:exodeoxyribonuclease VII small subunit [Anaerolineae bacterium]